jgi:hypothetical protein
MSRKMPPNKTSMNIDEFSKAFIALISQAVKDGVPLPHVILMLVMTHTELGILHVETMRNLRVKRLAEELAKNVPGCIPDGLKPVGNTSKT